MKFIGPTSRGPVGRRLSESVKCYAQILTIFQHSIAASPRACSGVFLDCMVSTAPATKKLKLKEISDLWIL